MLKWCFLNILVFNDSQRYGGVVLGSSFLFFMLLFYYMCSPYLVLWKHVQNCLLKTYIILICSMMGGGGDMHFRQYNWGVIFHGLKPKFPLPQAANYGQSLIGVAGLTVGGLGWWDDVVGEIKMIRDHAWLLTNQPQLVLNDLPYSPA